MPRRRFAEAVCVGHPDRLADTIAAGVVDLACARDPEALVGVEVAVHRAVVFLDGRIAAGRGDACAVREAEVEQLVRDVFREAGYGETPGGTFGPEPAALEVRFDLCLGPLSSDERAIRGVSDDQSISVGHAVAGVRAGWRPVEQALATDFASAIERLRAQQPQLGLGPDGKTLVVVQDRVLEAVSVSIQHRPQAEWMALVAAVREACAAVAQEYVEAGELDPLPRQFEWLINGAGAFEVGGPLGDNGLSGKKLVAAAYGTSVPIGGGALHGKDPHKVDPRGQALARRLALELVQSGKAREATVWVAFRPGDVEPRWVEIEQSPPECLCSGSDELPEPRSSPVPEPTGSGA